MAPHSPAALRRLSLVEEFRRMNRAGDDFVPKIERFREYLRLLARTHLASDRIGKIEPSDVVQQTLLEAHEQRDHFRGRTDAELVEWLKQMLRNNLTDAIRRQECAKRDVRRERRLEAEIEDSFSRADGRLAAEVSSPSGQAIRAEELLQMADGIAQLPPDQREAVVAHHLEGSPLAEIAVRLERSESAVAGLLHRGLKGLREYMKPNGCC